MAANLAPSYRTRGPANPPRFPTSPAACPEGTQVREAFDLVQRQSAEQEPRQRLTAWRLRLAEVEKQVARATPDSDFLLLAASESERRVLTEYITRLEASVNRSSEHFRILQGNVSRLWSRSQEILGSLSHPQGPRDAAGTVLDPTQLRRLEQELISLIGMPDQS